MRTFGFIGMCVACATAGYTSRYGVGDMGFWLLTIPIAAWIGMTSSLAFPGDE